MAAKWYFIYTPFYPGPSSVFADPLDILGNEIEERKRDHSWEIALSYQEMKQRLHQEYIRVYRSLVKSYKFNLYTYNLTVTGKRDLLEYYKCINNYTCFLSI